MTAATWRSLSNPRNVAPPLKSTSTRFNALVVDRRRARGPNSRNRICWIRWPHAQPVRGPCRVGRLLMSSSTGWSSSIVADARRRRRPERGRHQASDSTQPTSPRPFSAAQPSWLAAACRCRRGDAEKRRRAHATAPSGSVRWGAQGLRPPSCRPC